VQVSYSVAGRVDYVRATDPVTTRKAKATQGMSTATYYQSVVHATWVNNNKKRSTIRGCAAPCT
jgi:hypothetical protein